MQTSITSILGIPIHKVSMPEVIDRIQEMIQEYKADGRARYVATVNVDFLSNTWGWRPGQTRHPELLEILRQADLITADGMPLVWLSKLLGTPLPTRVTGADMVKQLAERCARNEQSIFLFGAKEGLGEIAAELLLEQYPGLKIAGTLSPYIEVQGRQLVDSDERDQHIIDVINQAKPDVLLIALGNPKQEQWFQRIQQQLKVPVAIGVGGAFNFIAGSVKRAPRWVQEAGFEWLFRVAQEPRRLWKRYAIGAWNLLCTAGPLLFAHALQALIPKAKLIPSQLSVNAFRKNGRVLQVCEIKLAAELSAQSCCHTVQELREADPVDALVFDFTRARRMDPEGLGCIHALCREARRRGIPISSYGVAGLNRVLLQLHRMTNITENPIYRTRKELEAAIDGMKTINHVHLSVDDRDAFRILNVNGKLCQGRLDHSDYVNVMEHLDGKNCIVDLSQCPFIDGSGLGFLLKVRRRLLANNRLFVLCGLNASTHQTLRIASLQNTLAIAATETEAEATLRSSEALICPKNRA